jgi:uncharacterized protein (TIGR02118 family)
MTRQDKMTIGAKLIVMFPQPKNVEEFESLYREQHTLLAEKIGNKTLLVEAKIVAAPMGPMPHYRITEIHFPTREALETCLGSPAGQLAMLQAVRISTGGAPVFLIAEEQTTRFGW